MEVSQILILLLLCFNYGCKDKPNDDCKDIKVSNEAFYSNAEQFDFRLVKHVISGDCLELTLEYSGCQKAKTELIASEDIAESEPPQRDIRFALGETGACEKLIRSDYRFNISDLQTAGHKIMLNIKQLDSTLIYEY